MTLELTAHRNVDVLVVGGGTSGVAAAIAAAEEGADVLVVERDSALGGVGIRAGVHFYYCGSLGGLQGDLDRGTRGLQKQLGGRVRGFHPEAKWMTIAERFSELSIEVIFDAIVADVRLDRNRVVGVVVETEEHQIQIDATVTVDATGNGDVAWLAGAEYTSGRAWDGVQHPYSLVPRYVDERGYLGLRNFDVGWVDSTDARDVSRAYRAGRQSAWRNEENPSNTHYLVVGPQLGIREGRNIIGDYVLTQDDLLLDRQFEDTVMRCLSHHDTHSHDYANESDLAQIWNPILGMRMFRFGGAVPYRAFVPRGLDGLLIGCRALSQDHDCAMGLRMQRDMHKVGEVAGLAGAMAAATGVPPRKIDVPALQQRLVDRGVLAADDLQRPSVPWLRLSSLVSQPPLITDLIPLLGTPEEYPALWWIIHYGPSAIPQLLRAFANAAGSARRSIAFALGLLNDPAGVPELLATIKRRDSDYAGDEMSHSEQRWVAALIILRMMRSPAAISEVIAMLTNERRSPIILYLLHYLTAVADQLSDSDRDTAIGHLHSMLSESDLGDDYSTQDSGQRPDAPSESTSMAWGIELTAGYFFEQVGADGRPIIASYLDDERGYCRRFARLLLDRLDAKEASAHELR